MRKIWLLGGALAAMVVGTSAAMAGPTYGTFTVGVLGNVTTTPSNTSLSSITSFTLPSGGEQVTGLPSTYENNTNVFTSILSLSAPVTVSPLTLPVPTVGTQVTENLPTAYLNFGPTSTSGSHRFAFTLKSLSSGFSNGSLDLYGSGLFSDLTGTLGTNLPASYAFSLSQTNSTSAVSYSGTFSVPPATPVSEPGSLLLLGTGVLMLEGGLLLRKRGRLRVRSRIVESA